MIAEKDEFVDLNAEILADVSEAVGQNRPGLEGGEEQEHPVHGPALDHDRLPFDDTTRGSHAFVSATRRNRCSWGMRFFRIGPFGPATSEDLASE